MSAPTKYENYSFEDLQRALDNYEIHRGAREAQELITECSVRFNNIQRILKRNGNINSTAEL